jgi:dolichyl-diphosphooligosaccharide--protein glycosyltransferase
MTTAREVADLVAERPALEPAIEAALRADEPFTFDDLAIDSGAFGELVAAGVVTEHDDGYHVTDRTAVERGLAGETDEHTADERALELSLPTVDRQVVGALAGALLFVVALRTVLAAGAVFRDGAVVLSGNDPYYYRYWVEQLLANPDVTLSSLPDTVTKGEPLYVATMWLLAVVLGGTKTAAGWVLAVYPVVSALVSGLLVYLLTVEVTDDRRVALAAVLMLAVLPAHAFRTSLGFADHHAFDYPWLGVTALSLVVLVREQLRFRSRRTALGVVGLAVGVTGQVLAWEAGPLLIAPVGLTIAALTVVWVRGGRSPARNGAPVLVGLLGAAVTTWSVHVTLGWQTDVVASAPALLLVGSAAALAIGEGTARVYPDARVTTGALLGSGLVSLAGAPVLLPEAWATLTSRAGSSLFRSDRIAETQGLFADSAGWLLLFGFLLFLAVPYLGWATRRSLDEDRWVVPVAYGWAFLALSLIQVRFAGEFATFAAVFAGLGLLHLAERIDVARRPRPFANDIDGRRIERPSRRQLGALLALFLLVSSLSLVQVPVKTSQVTTPPERYETAAWMSDYSESAAWGERPTYVFSPWSYNRVYNYFVSGDSRSYGYARANYERFLASSNTSEWYERLRGRAGFVVYRGTAGPPGSIAERLAVDGSRTENATGLAHYRAVHVSESGEYKVFTLVPGATITGTAETNETIPVPTRTRVSGVRIDSEREVRTGSDGTYSVTVPYPGTYQVGETEVEVPETAVRNGTTVRV